MIPPEQIVKDLLQALRDPALQGGGVIVSSIASFIALLRSHKPHTHPISKVSFKKISN